MAEVLITLGIIGIVAALTMPSLIIKHQKEVTVKQLKKFYTNINQAIKMAEIDHGSHQYWNYPEVLNYESAKQFFDKYIAKYMQIISEEKFNEDQLLVKFSDGSAMILQQWETGTDILFWPQASKIEHTNKKNYFAFVFNKPNSPDYKKGTVEPYASNWNGTRDDLLNAPIFGCKASGTYCAKLIQYDGWQIREDYPWKK